MFVFPFCFECYSVVCDLVNTNFEMKQTQKKNEINGFVVTYCGVDRKGVDGRL
jgi:hypothetical protein